MGVCSILSHSINIPATKTAYSKVTLSPAPVAACMCTYVSMCTYRCRGMYLHMCVCTCLDNLCMHPCMHAHTYIQYDTHLYTNTHAHTYYTHKTTRLFTSSQFLNHFMNILPRRFISQISRARKLTHIPDTDSPPLGEIQVCTDSRDRPQSDLGPHIHAIFHPYARWVGVLGSNIFHLYPSPQTYSYVRPTWGSDLGIGQGSRWVYWGRDQFLAGP